MEPQFEDININITIKANIPKSVAMNPLYKIAFRWHVSLFSFQYCIGGGGGAVKKTLCTSLSLHTKRVSLFTESAGSEFCIGYNWMKNKGQLLRLIKAVNANVFLWQ